VAAVGRRLTVAGTLYVAVAVDHSEAQQHCNSVHSEQWSSLFSFDLYASTTTARFVVFRSVSVRLGRLHQQKAQQGVDPADMSQSLLAGAGIFTRNDSHVVADLHAMLKPSRSSDDQHVGERR
jgi:hypothetical protein